MKTFSKKQKNKTVYGTEINLGACTDFKSKILYVLFSYIIIFCGLVGITELTAAAFGIVFDRDFVYKRVLAALVLFVPLSEYIWVRIPVYFAAASYFVKLWQSNSDMIKNGLKGIMNISYPLIRTAFNFPAVDGFDNAAANGSGEINMLIFFAVAVTALVLTVLVKYRAAILTAILCALPACGCIFLGAQVDFKLSLLLIVCILGVFALKKGRGKIRFLSRKYNKKIKLTNLSYEITFPLIILVAAFVYIKSGGILTQQKFDSKVQVSSVEKTMKRTATDMASIWFSDYKHNSQTDYADGGQLAFFTSMEITDSVKMQLKLLPFTEDNIFLRSYIGSVYKYNENKWENINYDGRFAEEKKSALEASGAEYNKIMFSAKGERNLFDSYNCVSSDIGYKADDSLKFNGDETDSYELDIYDKGTYTENPEYKDFVYSNYLQVPDENRAVIDAICAEQGFVDNDELLAKIQQYLNDNFEFTYYADVTPMGKDYVNTFLTETKRGNFVHYATAATLIYRSLGIPARYVCGYSVPYELVMSSDDTDDDIEDWLTEDSIYNRVKKVDISDQSLYAWVETYSEVDGWTPRDVCEVAFDELTGSADGENPDGEQTEGEQKEQKEKEEKPKKAKKELFKAYLQNAYEIPKVEGEKVQTSVLNTGKKICMAIPFVLMFAVIVFVLVFVLKLIYFIIVGKNKKAEIIYKNIAKKTGVKSGIRDCVNNVDIAQSDKNLLISIIDKAMFSEKNISDEELKMLLKAYKSFVLKTIIKRKKGGNS